MHFISFLFIIGLSIQCIYGGILNDTNRQWYPPIKYAFGYWTQYYYVMQAMQKAINTIQSYTCLNFTRNDSLRDNEQGIKFIWHNHNCRSDNIGAKGNNSLNIIYISYGCQYNYIRIQALILEALGVYPEQTRPDRDEYVTIYYGNITTGTNLTYFNISNNNITTDYDTHYDYGSVSHYYSYSYGKGDKQTIAAIGKYSDKYQKMIGQKLVVTFNDYKLINRHFCKSHINESLECRRNGYEHPRKPKECLCPHPFTNGLCTGLLLNSKGGCPPQHVDALYKTEFYSYTISSYRTCYGYIETKERTNEMKVEFGISYMNMNPQSLCTRSYSMVEIKYKTNKDVMGLCFCGQINTRYTVFSEDNLIVFIYNGWYWSDRFKYEYRAVKYRDGQYYTIG